MQGLICKAAAATTLLALAAGPANAQSAVFGAEAFHGLAEVRLASATGERGWLDGGFGKTDAQDGLSLSKVTLEWRPRFNFAVSAVVTADLQPQVSGRPDLGEAYLKLTAPPNALGRASARIGVFYPPVSLENTGVGWTHPDMISASALNTWIGEEVKVQGMEARLSHPFDAHEVAVTVGVYGWDDTAGTLLSFRGWSEGSTTAPVSRHLPLPPLSPFITQLQPRQTTPRLELDNRAGYYGQLEWSPPWPVRFAATYYDNAGNRVAVDAAGEWSWETRFVNLGLVAEPDERTKITAQALTGVTLMGFKFAGQTWVDVAYDAAFVEVRRGIGDDALSGRLDWFDARDRSLRALDDNTESGWSATGAWRKRLAPHADLIVELQHMSSDRPARVLTGVSPRQTNTLLQSALRLSF